VNGSRERPANTANGSAGRTKSPILIGFGLPAGTGDHAKRKVTSAMSAGLSTLDDRRKESLQSVRQSLSAGPTFEPHGPLQEVVNEE
jgi:hypothetical protein